jgi:putative redox protein
MVPNKIEVSWVDGDQYTVQVGEHQLYIDQPVEGGGTDTAPTPTELFVASLAACVAYYGGRFLARHGLARSGLRVLSEFEMATAPARVGRIRLHVSPPQLPERLRPALHAVVTHCTVHNTLDSKPTVVIDID